MMFAQLDSLVQNQAIVPYFKLFIKFNSWEININFKDKVLYLNDNLDEE